MTRAASEAIAVDVELIVAMTREGLIGRGGDLPWHSREDLAHFKRTTSGHTLVMGRKTWDSLPGLLPKRRHVVISRTRAGGAGPDGMEADGARFFGSLEHSLAWLAGERAAGRVPQDEKLFVIGGAELFRLALDELQPSRLVVTWMPSMELQPDDVRFPVNEAWIDAHYDVASRAAGADEALDFVVYERRCG